MGLCRGRLKDRIRSMSYFLEYEVRLDVIVLVERLWSVSENSLRSGFRLDMAVKET